MTLLPKTAIFIGLLVIGSACSPLATHGENDALCDAQLGNPCTDIQDADGQGSNARTIKEHPVDTQNAQLSQDILLPGKTNIPALSGPDGGAPYYVKSYRTPEVLATAWIAPRLDESGIFHEATFIHFVVQEAGWGGKKGAN